MIIKTLINNQKCVVSNVVTILIVFSFQFIGYADVTPVKDRTSQVCNTIVAAVPGVNNAADVTKAHIAAITSLNLRSKGISVLKIGDFSGLTALTSLNLYNNQLSILPIGIFEELTSLTTIRLGRNTVDPLPFTVAIEKVTEGQFRAVAPAGALFNIVLPITVTNGSITGGASKLTIPQGSVGSNTLTVTRNADTTAHVTVDIGTLPSPPRNHYGYALVKSHALPITIISGTNTAPMFTDGASTTRSIAENTATGQNIGTAVAAKDAENDTLTYTLNGTDASAFDIESTTGQLKTKAALDYETKNTYTVTITATDVSLTGTITVTINIINVHEVVPPPPNSAPVFIEGSSTTRTIAENTALGQNIGTAVAATDADGHPLTYTLSGTDAASFRIVSTSGQLQTNAALDYETKRIYSVTITVSDEELSSTITVIISLIDVNDTLLSAGFVPVADRTPEVRDAIVTAVPHVTTATNVTESQVAAITNLNLRNRGISKLKIGDFSGMSSLTSLNLFGNRLRRLPTGTFNGLTALSTLRLGGNAVDPIPLIVSLQQAGDNTFKAVITTGAPFDVALPISVANGSIRGGVTSVTIPQGAMASPSFTVIGTTAEVSFGTIPGLPRNHFGYELAQSTVCNRTEKVAAAIAKAVRITDCRHITELDLALMTSLDLSNQSIKTLKTGDFDDMLSLRTLYLNDNDLTSLPSGIFDDLVSLRTLRLDSNKLTTVHGGICSNLTSLTILYLPSNDLRALPRDAFEGLSALSAINLQDNDLTSLPDGVFDGTPNLTSIVLSNNKLTTIPNGIFEGLTQLKQIHLSGNPNANAVLSLTVSLQKVATNQLKAVLPSGAPFAIVVPISVKNGTLAGGATSLQIPISTVESLPITVTRTAGTTEAVTANIGTLPKPPTLHKGYALAKGTGLPLEVFPPVNSPPAFTDGATTTRTVAENTVANENIGTAIAATDVDGDTLTYTLGGTDVSSFSIVSTSGQLQTSAALDYETQTSYSVTITVSDGTATDTITVTINVTDINEAPSFTDGDSIARSIDENTVSGTNIGSVVSATDEDGEILTYSLGGTGASSFSIDSTTGQLQTNASLDYETKSSYSVSISVSDGTLTDTITATINITDVDETIPNRAPVFTEGSSTTRSIAENTVSGTNIGTAVSATDADNDTLTYTLSGTDAASFGIDSTSGQLQTKAALDYEAKTSYSVTVAVSDGNGGSDSITVTINVTDVYENRAPVFTEGNSATRTVAENTEAGSNIGDAVSATDQDAKDTLTYTLSGTDAAAFDIDSTTGQIKTKAALDFETKNIYSVTLTVSDGLATDTIAVTINVTDVHENRAPVFTEGNSATRTVAENTEAGSNIGDAITATDPDNDTLTCSLGGQDASAFGMDTTTGQLRTHASLDYETKSIYAVSVTVSDGKLTATIAVTINITDVDELPDQVAVVKGVSANSAPVFTAGSSTTRSIAENTANGTNIGSPISATDADNNTLTYSLGGTDAPSFRIDSTTGQLQTNTALDYETKNTYSVTVSVSDGNGGSDSITVTINVTDVTEISRQRANSAPIFTEGDSTTRAVAEYTDSGVDIGAPVSATDADADTLTYSLGGTDANAFNINSTTGQLQTNAVLDYATKPSYTVTITASDGTDEAIITVTINVIDVTENRAPVFTAGSSTTRSIAENSTNGTNIGSPISATDADDNTLTYSLGGTDAASFRIVSTSGQLQTNAALDYENKNTYSVTVSVSDGNGGSDSTTVTINVTDVTERPQKRLNSAPIFTEGDSTTRAVVENTASGTNIGSAFAVTDADNDTLTYSLSGADAASFSIIRTSGQLRTRAALNYESKSSYSVSVSVSDGNGGSDNIAVTINVTNVNEAPSFTEGSSTTRSIAENTTSGTNIGTAVAATDVDANTTLSYTLGGTDASSFSIVSTTGQLQTSAALDYESKISYSVSVSVSDGNGGSDSITVTINVTDVYEFTPVNERTQQVQDEIVAVVPNVKNAADVTAAHLAAITSLTIDYRRITALKVGDFDGFTSLTNLVLKHNSISDLSALAKLTSLKWLFLGFNSISDLSALAKLTSLEWLYLHNNSISDISTLGKLTSLKQLFLSYNSISDISALEKLTALTWIDLSRNSISDISALEKLTALTNLKMDWNSISDISALEKLTALTDLNLHWNPISDISALAKLTSLKRLILSNNWFSDISALENLTALTELALNNNSITDVSAVENLTGLTELGLSGNQISDYGPIHRLKAAIGVIEDHPGLTIDITIPAVEDNNAPVFSDGDSTTRSVAENTVSGANIGSVVAATDADTEDTLTYHLGGTDADSFRIVKSSGQLQTNAELDAETKSTYTVKVAVSDGKGGTDSITVTINVTDVASAAPSLETSPVIPDNTALLTNFPNPFNPETWVPYQLAKPAKVTLTIYNMRGVVVRTIALGHKAADVYTSRSRAIHWDGRNMFGEKVAAGLYFYTLTAGDWTATRKMLIRK